LIHLENISKELDIEFHITGEIDNTVAVLELIPIIKEGNLLKKVISFELQYDIYSLAKKQEKTFEVKDAVLAIGEWYKFSVDTTGVFKIDKSFLQSLGVDVKNINPKKNR